MTPPPYLSCDCTSSSPTPPQLCGNCEFLADFCRFLADSLRIPEPGRGQNGQLSSILSNFEGGPEVLL